MRFSWGQFLTFLGAAERFNSRRNRMQLRIVHVGAQFTSEGVDELMESL